MKISNSDFIKNNNTLSIKNSEEVILSLEENIEEINIDVLSNVKASIIMTDFYDTNINFFIQNNASLELKIVNNETKKRLNLKANLCRNAIFNTYFADLSDTDIILNSNVILYGENSASEFRFASLAKNNNNKYYSISFSHLNERTSSILTGFGVSQNNATIKCIGTSHIEKDSIKSSAKQSVKVILFDETSKAIASPTLKIDCDDIKASHGCAIGALNEDHLFYLLSRGLNITDARKLITTGYLIPITQYFDGDLKEKIFNEINGSL